MQAQKRRRGPKQRTLPRHPGWKELRETLVHADVLLVVPPFAWLKHPSLGVHLLQACGRQAGLRVQVLYANLLLARVIGEEAYSRIYDAPMGSFAAERFFARSAYGVPAMGRQAERMLEPSWVISADHGADVEPDFGSGRPITLRELRRLEARAAGFLDTLAKAVSERSYKIVGCTTTAVIPYGDTGTTETGLVNDSGDTDSSGTKFQFSASTITAVLVSKVSKKDNCCDVRPAASATVITTLV